MSDKADDRANESHTASIDAATVAWLNGLTPEERVATLARCCGSDWWQQRVADSAPYADGGGLMAAVESAFDAMPRDAWLGAFDAHPNIGDLESLRMRYAGNREWSAGEQSGVNDADETTLERLAAGNAAYAKRFGYRFIVCATGRSAAEMLAMLESRLPNDPEAELPIAAAEQQKITHLRLAKLTPPPLAPGP